MRKLLFLVAFVCVVTTSNAQKLSFEKLDELLNLSMDEAEENLFLIGYTFLSKEPSGDSAVLIRTFTNRKNTIGTAKAVSKGIYAKDATKSFLRYKTYDRVEFEKFRKLMVEYEFIRSSKDNISENSNYTKDNLKVNFEVTTDKYENKTFFITLQNYKSASSDKAVKKLSLKKIFKQE